MKHIRLLSLLLILTFSVQAQELMTLDQARQMALENDHDLKIAEQTTQRQELLKKVAETYYLPSISAQGGALYQSNDISETADLSIPMPEGLPIKNIQASLPIDVSFNGAYMAGIQVNQAIYAGGKVRSSNKMAELGVEIAGENQKMQQVNTVVKTDQAYWTYVAVQSKVKLAQKNFSMLESVVKQVKDSYDVGYSNQNDLLKIQVKYNKAKLDLQKAKNGLELTRMSLCQIIGIDLDTPVKTDTNLVVEPDVLAELGEEDVANRPEYQILQKQVDLAESKIKNTRANYLPQLGVSASYGAWGGVDINSMNLSTSGFSAAAMLKIPIFNWGKGSKEIKSAKLEQQMKNEELLKNTQLMQLELTKARFALKEAAMTIDMCKTNVQQAKENRRMSADNYELGRESITNLLIAQTQWQEAENELIEAKINFKLSETDYLRTSAQLIIEH
ncbi:MAG: TolC family protein [Mangrovibacterium sp.]